MTKCFLQTQAQPWASAPNLGCERIYLGGIAWMFSLWWPCSNNHGCALALSKVLHFWSLKWKRLSTECYTYSAGRDAYDVKTSTCWPQSFFSPCKQPFPVQLHCLQVHSVVKYCFIWGHADRFCFLHVAIEVFVDMSASHLRYHLPGPLAPDLVQFPFSSRQAALMKQQGKTLVIAMKVFGSPTSDTSNNTWDQQWPNLQWLVVVTCVRSHWL